MLAIMNNLLYTGKAHCTELLDRGYARRTAAHAGSECNPRSPNAKENAGSLGARACTPLQHCAWHSVSMHAGCHMHFLHSDNHGVSQIKTGRALHGCAIESARYLIFLGRHDTMRHCRMLCGSYVSPAQQMLERHNVRDLAAMPCPPDERPASPAQAHCTPAPSHQAHGEEILGRCRCASCSRGCRAELRPKVALSGL